MHVLLHDDAFLVRLDAAFRVSNDVFISYRRVRNTLTLTLFLFPGQRPKALATARISRRFIDMYCCQCILLHLKNVAMTASWLFDPKKFQQHNALIQRCCSNILTADEGSLLQSEPVTNGMSSPRYDPRSEHCGCRCHQRYCDRDLVRFFVEFTFNTSRTCLLERTFNKCISISPQNPVASYRRR